jgi:uncharacterized protein
VKFGTDRAAIGKYAIDETTGYMHTTINAARVGILDYPEEGKKRYLSDQVLKDAVETMKYKSFTDQHPTEAVNSENYQNYHIGITKEQIEFDGNWAKTAVLIQDKGLIDAILEKKVREVSMGYFFEEDNKSGIYKGEKYDSAYTKVRYNHVAAVDYARAGKDAKFNIDKKGVNKMKYKVDGYKVGTITIDGKTIDYNEDSQAAIDTLINDNDAIKKEAGRLATDADKLGAENAVIKEQLKEAQEALEGMISKDGIEDEIRKLTNVREKARQLGIQADGKDALETMKEVIVARMPNAKINMDSNDAIEAAFEAITANMQHAKELKHVNDARRGVEKGGIGASQQTQRLQIDSALQMRNHLINKKYGAR